MAWRPLNEYFKKYSTHAYHLTGGDVEVGDRDKPYFYPKMRMGRWKDECLLELEYETAEEGTHESETDKDGKEHHRWKGKDVEIEFYPLDPREEVLIDPEGREHRFTQNELQGFEFGIKLKKNQYRIR